MVAREGNDVLGVADEEGPDDLPDERLGVGLPPVALWARRKVEFKTKNPPKTSSQPTRIAVLHKRWARIISRFMAVNGLYFRCKRRIFVTGNCCVVPGLAKHTSWCKSTFFFHLCSSPKP